MSRIRTVAAEDGGSHGNRARGRSEEVEVRSHGFCHRAIGGRPSFRRAYPESPEPAAPRALGRVGTCLPPHGRPRTTVLSALGRSGRLGRRKGAHARRNRTQRKTRYGRLGGDRSQTKRGPIWRWGRRMPPAGAPGLRMASLLRRRTLWSRRDAPALREIARPFCGE